MKKLFLLFFLPYLLFATGTTNDCYNKILVYSHGPVLYIENTYIPIDDDIAVQDHWWFQCNTTAYHQTYANVREVDYYANDGIMDRYYFDLYRTHYSLVYSCPSGSHAANLGNEQICVSNSSPTGCQANETGGCTCPPGTVNVGGACVTDPEADSDGDGIPNKNDPDSPVYDPDDPDSDPDMDGIPNKNDWDDDGDGIADKDDPDHADYDPFANPEDGCRGKNVNDKTFYGVQYLSSKYTYLGISTLQEDCYDYLSNDSYDGILEYGDLEDTCEISYCFAHMVEFNCGAYIPEDFKPSADYIYKSASSANACDNLAYYNLQYTAATYIMPNTVDCPNLGFCFVLPDPEYDGDEPDPETDDDPTLDENSSNAMADLAPLLASQNINNELLRGTNDKIDNLNDNVQNLHSMNDQILQEQSETTKAINNLDMESLDRHITNAISENRDVLSDMRNTMNHQTDRLNSIASTNAQAVEGLDNIASGLNDLFTGENPFLAEYTDGSEGFGGFQTDIEGSFSTFEITDPFGLNQISAVAITPVTFTVAGTSFTLWDSSTFSALPLADIRLLFLFVAALGGFITVMRTI